MSRTVTVDQLSTAVAEVLEEYGDKVKENLDDIVLDVSKQGVKAVKSNARGAVRKGTGEYFSGWTSRVESGRFSAQGTIYNSTVPGLPHLLEHGHALRQGGRAPGRVHIAPVNDAIAREFKAQVMSKL